MSADNSPFTRQALTLRIYALLTVVGVVYSLVGQIGTLVTGGDVYIVRGILVELIYWYAWGPLIPWIYRMVERQIQRGIGTRELVIRQFLASLVFPQLAWLAQVPLWLIYYFWSQALTGRPVMGMLEILKYNFRSYYLDYFGLFLGSVVYAGIAGASLARLWWLRYRQAELDRLQLESQLARSELQALKMQLHPHFLFNTLNSISSLLRRDPESADRMIARLGEFLRMTLERGESPVVSLADELDFVERYLAIEQIRFGERLKVDVEVQPELNSLIVPNLMLQPIIENAVRHGVARRAEAGWIRIQARIENGHAVIQVIDSGAGEHGTPRRQAPENEGIGLRNTRERLRQVYGAAASLELHRHQDGRFESRIQIALPGPETEESP
ncbi:MAG: histidine kinase [Candidatus Cloacimonetes bacterium]|nr:histidine kinase [Candidatus Cloacimonadota bacterium]